MMPGAKLSIDETLYPFWWPFGALQFIKSKPARYGIKYWTIVDNGTNCVPDIIVYFGKNGDASKPKEKSVGQSVVLK